MADFFIDTSYKRNYVVLAVTSEGVILRPISDGDDPIPSYWQEFIKENSDEPYSEDTVPTLRLTQLPAEVLCVDAYVEYAVEYPRAEVRIGNKIVDVSDKIACNHPNPETPGLYALDFTLSLMGEAATPIWRSWVSIEEPPILRQIITPWNRESRPIADLNRLVVEPQFNEALYEAGVPLYNFQQANAPAAVSQANSQRYKDARAFVKGGRLFITGPQLPVGTEATVNNLKRTLGVPLMTPKFRQFSTYYAGEVVSYGGYQYYAVMDIPKHEVVDAEDDNKVKMGSAIPDTIYKDDDGNVVMCWLAGFYYTIDEIDMPDGEYALTALWAVLDVNGYLFKMDLKRAFPVHHYWGHYNRKYFYDYAPGDLVSLVSDNVIYLYQRNETSIDEKGIEETYRPGHYKNPHWTEVYSASNNSMLRDPAILPYTNSLNAVVSKTYPVREEAFRLYARMVGMPAELVDAIGTKRSVLLWAMLYRTRETFPGIRAAMRAIGMDIPDLHREYPSVVYSKYGYTIENVYDEIATVKSIARSVEADKVWTGSDDPDVDNVKDMRNVKYADIPWVRYSREGEEPDCVFEFDPVERKWVRLYSFKHIGSDKSPELYDFSVNNRYYKATVNLLDRLAKECVVDVGDDKQWIDHNYVGSILEALSALLHYEVPIYIYFRLKLQLVAIGHLTVRGVSGGVALMDAWGGPIGLKLFPGKYFDFRTLTVEIYYPTLLYSYEQPDGSESDDGWTEYKDYVNGPNFRYFAFEQAVYIRMKFPPTRSGIQFLEHPDGKWISQFTIGCLGNPASPGTGDYKPDPDDHGFSGFMDATHLGAGTDLYLCKGMVGATMRIKPNDLTATALCLHWQYYLSDPDKWVMDEVRPFAGWSPIEVRLFGYWSGTLAAFKDAIAGVSTPDGDVPFEWDENEPATLLIGGDASSIVYLWNSSGYVIGMLQFTFTENLEVDGLESQYRLKVTFEE